MPKKKKLKRKLKKGARALGKVLRDAAPALLSGKATAFAGAGGLLVAAALDPRVQESARGLVSAISDFVRRNTMGEAANDQSLERH
jgi:hypothetical protein